jgi:lipopolysaccharide heptosyltransferase II
MTGPAIRALASQRPDRRITVLTSSAGAEVAPLLPGVDEVLTYDPPWMKATERRTSAARDHRTLLALRGRRFDGAVIFTVYTQSALPAALLCFLAGIPLRLAHCRENPYQLLTDWVPDPEPGAGVRHEVRRQLDLVAAVGARARDECLALRIPPAARARAAAALAGAGLDPDAPWALLHPGATAPSRRYPAERFGEVVRRLTGELGWQVLLVGGGADADTVDRIRRLAGTDPPAVVGSLSLPELAALIERAPLMIANNSGPMHLAAAAGTPVVAIYALTNPQHTPWGVPGRILWHDVPCRFCYRSVCPEGHHRCVLGVAPEDVVAAALDLWRAPGPPLDGSGIALPVDTAGPRSAPIPPGPPP